MAMAYKNPNIFDENTSLTHHFLIAMPALNGSFFSQTVTYICDHNEDGAMGIVVNQPLDYTLKDIFQHMSLDPKTGTWPDDTVLSGGPVNRQQGFVLHRNEGKWDSTLEVTNNVCLTASKDIVLALAKGQAPKGAQFALGYAGWAPGQLEDELSDNSWLTMPATETILFDIPIEDRWAAAARHIGVDMNLISGTAGHA